MTVLPATPTFQDRVAELEAIDAGPTKDVRTLVFYGEAGIGKSRLLAEAAAHRKRAQALVLHVDLAALSRQRENRPLVLLRELAGQAALSYEGWADSDAAAQVIDQLGAAIGDGPATLLVDTTEAVQDDPDFWQWFERHVLSPLVSDGKLLIVLAGRLPAPIRLVEVRRYLKVWALEPLPVEHEARELVREVLAAAAAPRLDELTDVTLSFSHGHPRLSLAVAGYLADPANQTPMGTLRRRVAEEVVGPFINERIFPFTGDMVGWRKLMEQASVLDWFDATVLYRFAGEMSGDRQREIDWQYSFVKAMAQLRAPYAVVRWEGAGYTLVGAVKRIVASYMQAARHADYVQALEAAAAAFNWIAEEYFKDDPQAGEPYRHAAGSYQQRLDREVQHGSTEQRG